MSNSTTKTVFSVCPHDCPDTCAIRTHVSDGSVTRVEGWPDHPFTRGNLCRKVAHYEERLSSPDRVLHPLRRVGPKGAGEFERISWDQALDEIASRLQEIVSSHGPEAILPYSYAGTMGVVEMSACEGRLWNALGASRLDRTICSTAGEAGHTYTMGWGGGMDPEEFALSRFIIAWGTNLSSTNVHQMPFIREAQRQGATFVVIDPFRTRTANAADWFVQPRPGTDTALALAMMHVILRESLEDREYISEWTIGLDRLRERAAEFSPERVERITGIPAGEIERLAVRYATEQPSAIRLGYGLTRNSNGGMMARAIACLPALVGAWRQPGGGLLLSTSSHFKWDRQAVKRPDLLGDRKPRRINMNELGKALEAAEPPVMALVVWNCNPAAVAPNSNLVVKGLRREDLFAVVHEQLLTDTALYADLVLPATMQMERLDLHFAYGHLYAQLNQPAVLPPGECRTNLEFQNELARRLGFTDPCFDESAEDIIRKALATPDMQSAGITYERLSRDGYAKLPAPSRHGFPTSSGKVEFFSETARRDGHDPLPAYVPPAESAEGDPALAARFPLNLLSPAAHHFLNSSFANQPSLQAAEKGPRIWIHPEDAEPRGIEEGDEVRVFNDRGEVILTAVISDRAQPGMAWSPSLWWHRDSPLGRNVNALTSDRVTDLGGGPTFHTNLVEVVKP